VSDHRPRIAVVLRQCPDTRLMPLRVNLSQSQTTLLSGADTSRQNPKLPPSAGYRSLAWQWSGMALDFRWNLPTHTVPLGFNVL
jgi:hypothetical protein